MRADSKVVSIVSGMDHCLALTAGGEVYSWGASGGGRLGHGSPTSLRFFGSSSEFKPRLVRAFEALRITQVRGRRGALGLLPGRTARCRGPAAPVNVHVPVRVHGRVRPREAITVP